MASATENCWTFHSCLPFPFTMPTWNQFLYCCKPRGQKKWSCWRAFIPTAQFQRNFLCRFPYFPEAQCTTTKTKYNLQRNLNRHIRRKMVRELVTGYMLCVFYIQNWVIFLFRFFFFVFEMTVSILLNTKGIQQWFGHGLLFWQIRSPEIVRSVIR